MINPSWLKIVPYLAVAGVIWWALDAVYTQGREFEIAKCESEQAKADSAAINKLEKLREELEEEREKADRRATQIIGAYANEIEKLYTDLNSVNDKRLYITAKAASCETDRSAVSSSNKNTGVDTGEIKFEIPEEVGRAIWQDYKFAAGLEIKHNALVDLIESRPDCFDVVR